jgi:hypothetical protein
MASAEREPITGVWGQSPQRGPGAEPLVRGFRGEAPEAESILAFRSANEAQICPFFCYPVNCSNMLFERKLLRFCRLNTELFRV